MQPPTKIEQAEEILGEDLGAWCLRYREDERSWRWIADKLAEQTQVTITPQWLRHLFSPSAAA